MALRKLPCRCLSYKTMEENTASEHVLKYWLPQSRKLGLMNKLQNICSVKSNQDFYLQEIMTLISSMFYQHVFSFCLACLEQDQEVYYYVCTLPLVSMSVPTTYFTTACPQTCCSVQSKINILQFRVAAILECFIYTIQHREQHGETAKTTVCVRHWSNTLWPMGEKKQVRGPPDFKKQGVQYPKKIEYHCTTVHDGLIP